MKTAQASDLMVKDSQRYLMLEWVLTFVIKKLCPFSWVDDQDVRVALGNIAAYDAEAESNRFDPTLLHNQKFKHLVTEVYSTHRDIIRGSLAKYVYSRPIPSASLQFDIWTSKISGAKYMGT